MYSHSPRMNTLFHNIVFEAKAAGIAGDEIIGSFLR